MVMGHIFVRNGQDGCKCRWILHIQVKVLMPRWWKGVVIDNCFPVLLNGDCE